MMKILKVILIIMEPVQPRAQFCWKTLSKSPIWGLYPLSDKAGKNTYGPARKAYWSMRVCSVRRIKKHNSHMINCLLTELGHAGRENIWFSQDARTSSQIFSRPALPLNQ